MGSHFFKVYLYLFVVSFGTLHFFFACFCVSRRAKDFTTCVHVLSVYLAILQDLHELSGPSCVWHLVQMDAHPFVVPWDFGGRCDDATELGCRHGSQTKVSQWLCVFIKRCDLFIFLSDSYFWLVDSSVSQLVISSIRQRDCQTVNERRGVNGLTNACSIIFLSFYYPPLKQASCTGIIQEELTTINHTERMSFI